MSRKPFIESVHYEMEQVLREELELESFYAYGYRGRRMFAVRAPFATQADGRGLVGRTARIAGARYEIVAVSRQTTRPITEGESIGIEVRLQTHNQ